MFRKVIAGGIVLLVFFCASFLLSYSMEPDRPAPSPQCHLHGVCVDPPQCFIITWECLSGWTAGQSRCDCVDPR